MARPRVPPMWPELLPAPPESEAFSRRHATTAAATHLALCNQLPHGRHLILKGNRVRKVQLRPELVLSPQRSVAIGPAGQRGGGGRGRGEGVGGAGLGRQAPRRARVLAWSTCRCVNTPSSFLDASCKCVSTHPPSPPVQLDEIDVWRLQAPQAALHGRTDLAGLQAGR